MRGNLSEERKALLQKLVDEGLSIKDMWRLHRFTYNTVRRRHPNYRQAADGYIHKEKVMSLEELAKALKPYQEDRVPCKVAAQALGISEWRVRKHFPEMKWTQEEALEYANQVRKMERVKVRV